MWDLIVVGLGPAGSTAAREAASVGMKVLALDKACFPRYKPCAAGLTGRAVKRIPVDPARYVERTFDRARITLDSGQPIDVVGDGELMVTTRREVLDTLLVEAARTAGAIVEENTVVTGLRNYDEYVELKTSTGTKTGRFVIGADGANSVCLRHMTGKRLPFLPSWEVEFQYDSDQCHPESARLRFDLGIVNRGYGWVFPKSETVAVGVAGKLATRHEIDAAFEKLMKQLPGSQQWKPRIQRGHPIPIFSNKLRLAWDRVLLTGDAGGLIDPFLGEGIYHAILSGEIAAEWVKNNQDSVKPDYRNYQSLIHNAIGKELIYAARLAAVIYRFPRFMFKLTRRNPDVLKDFGRCLTDEQGYRSFATQIGYPYKMIFWGIKK